MIVKPEKNVYRPRVSLFWRYFALLFVVSLMFILALIISKEHYSNLIRESYLDVVREDFYQNCSTFSDEIRQTYSMIITLQSTQYFTDFSAAHAPLSSAQQVPLNQLRQFFSSQCNLQSMITDGFIIADHSKICITKRNVIEYAAVGLDDYFRFADGTSLYDTLKNTSIQNGYTVIPAANISINGIGQTSSSDTYLTLLAHPISSGFAFGFCCPTSFIQQIYNIASLPDGSFLQLESPSGTIYYAYNSEHLSEDDFIEFTNEVVSLPGIASLGIPKSYFSEMVEQATSSVRIIFLASIIIGFALCVIFSYFGVKPFRSLIDEHTMTHDKSNNELDTISNYLKRTENANHLLRNTLLSNLLVRAMYALPIEDSTNDDMTQLFPFFNEPLYLVIVRDRNAAKYSDNHGTTFDELLHMLPDTVIAEQLSIAEICLLESEEQFQKKDLLDILTQINVKGRERPQYACGVSSVFTGLANLSDAMQQARFAIPNDDEFGIGYYTKYADKRMSSSIRNRSDLKRLEQGLACWNEEDVFCVLQNYQHSSADYRESGEEIFYSILHLLRTAAQSCAIDFTPYENTIFKHDISAVTNLKRLEEITRYLFKEKAQLEITEMQNFQNNMKLYVEEHFSNPGLSVSDLASAFCVSEHFVRTTFLSSTGMSFSKFLLETRVRKTEYLLRTTDMSNIDISEYCGYTNISTFYRNFKSIYHVTPVAYKEQILRSVSEGNQP